MASPYASAAKIASAEAKLGGPIAQDDSLLLKQLVVALGNVTGGGGGGTGDVVGPASSTDSAIAAFDGATGKLLKDTTVKVGTGTVVLPGSISGTTTLQAPPIAGTAVITTPSVTGTLAITGNPLSQFASTTSAQLAGVISDETGSGSLVFATSPTLVTPLLGTPTSGVLTNCTGLPVSSGISGLGTGVATALAVNTGSAGAFVVNGGALGTPSSGTLTNCTGLPASGVTNTAAVLNAANTFASSISFSGTTNYGLRLNNLTTTQRDAIASPAAGIIVWNTTTSRLNLYDGSAWTSGFVRLAGDTMTGALGISANGAASTPAFSMTGTPFSGGTGTTTKPLALIECGSPASTGWGTSGTAFGINVSSGVSAGGAFRFVDFQVNGSSIFYMDQNNTSMNTVYANSFNWTGGQGALAYGGTFSDNYLQANTGILNVYGSSAMRVSFFNSIASSTSFERFKIDWKTTANVCRIGTSKGSGGGSNRALFLDMGDTTVMKFNTDGTIDLSNLSLTTEIVAQAKTFPLTVGGTVVKVLCA